MAYPKLCKSDLRSKLRIKRNELSSSYRKEAEKVIYDRVISSDMYKNADIILAYYPIGSEIDILPIINGAFSDKKRVAFPISVKADYSLIFKYVDSINDLKIGSYTIPEPDADCDNYLGDKNALCIVPGLAFDRSGNRIGYGKGFYDRFLGSYNGISLGLVYNDLLLDRLPSENTDIPVDVIISDREELFICEKQNK